MTRRIDTYLQDALDFLKRKKRVDAVEFKGYVTQLRGNEISPGRWHNFTKHLKNGAVVGSHAAVPFDNQWHWDPPMKIVLGWVGDVLQRHIAEILLCLRVLRLPRYKDKPYSEDVITLLEELQAEIEKTLIHVRTKRVRHNINAA